MLNILLNKAFWANENFKKFENDIVHNRNAKINYIGGGNLTGGVAEI